MLLLLDEVLLHLLLDEVLLHLLLLNEVLLHLLLADEVLLLLPYDPVVHGLPLRVEFDRACCWQIVSKVCLLPLFFS